jgi:hypothetical protein
MNIRDTGTYKGLLLAAMAGALLSVAPGAKAAQARWDVDLNPTNGFGGLTPAWSLTDPDSAAAEWNVFDGYPLATTPDVFTFGPGVRSVEELTGAAFLTSGGNIYSFAFQTAFEAILTGYGADPLVTRDVALRLSTLGTGVDAASVSLGGVAPTITQLAFQGAAGGPFGGSEEEWLFLWTAVPETTSYVFTFQAAGSSMSLDQLAMYLSPGTVVPLPAAGWLLLSAVGGLGVWQRRFRSAR